MSNYLKKAPFNDWWYWSDVLAKRLRTVSEIYKENDERERAQEMSGVAQRLTKLFGEIAQKGMRAKKPEEKLALAQEEEAAIYEGIGIWRDMLSALPFISEAMEAFLGYAWRNVDPLKGKDDKDSSDKGKTSGGNGGSGGPAAKARARAVELFWGPDGRFDEGIRSGLPEDGGLPGILINMLAAEKTNSNRTPSEYKNEQAHTQYYGRDAKNTMKGPGMGGGM